MNESKLLACPFCGSQPESKEIIYTGMPIFQWEVKCQRCGRAVSHSYKTQEDAESKWNVRAGDREPAMSETRGTKGVGISDLLAAAKRDAAFYRKTLEQICEDERKTRGRRIAETALMFWDRIKAEAAERKKAKADNE